MMGCGLMTAAADDWPEFRGPTAQGTSTATGLPTKWGPAENVVWRTEIAGTGWSSPVVIGEKIYLTTAVSAGGGDAPDADRSLRVICLSAGDGKIAWDKEVFAQKGSDAPKIHKKNSHASPTVIADEGKIYAHFGHQGTACLDAAGGDILWSTREFAYKPVHGNGGSPVIADDLLIFNADAADNPGVLALDKKTGKLRWRFDRKSEASRKFSFCTPLLIEVKGRRQLITPGSGVVNALDPKTGAEIWHANYGQGYSVVPRPIYSHGLIFLSTGYDSPIAMAISPEGKGDVTATHIAWQITKRAPHNPSMVVAGDHLYMVADNGIMSCIEPKTGKVVWEERTTGPISASLLFADRKIYLQDEVGLGVVIEPGITQKIIAKNDLKERSLASYAVCGNDLLIRTQAALYRIGKK